MALLTASLLFITGCGASVEPSTSQTSDEAAPVSKAPTQETVVSEEPTQGESEAPERTILPLKESCWELIVGGHLSETAEFLTNVDELSETTAAEAQEISGQLEEIAGTAEDELARPVRTMAEPLDDFVEAWDTRGTWGAGDRQQTTSAAMQKALEMCEPLVAGAAPPEPTAFPTSGDFASDLEAAGIETDDPDDYRKLMVKRLCESDLDSALMGFTRYVRMSRGGGKNDDGLRLVVAYGCPDRVDDLEDAFIYLNDE